jgi:hypothetical protein
MARNVAVREGIELPDQCVQPLGVKVLLWLAEKQAEVVIVIERDLDVADSEHRLPQRSHSRKALRFGGLRRVVGDEEQHEVRLCRGLVRELFILGPLERRDAGDVGDLEPVPAVRWAPLPMLCPSPFVRISISVDFPAIVRPKRAMENSSRSSFRAPNDARDAFCRS